MHRHRPQLWLVDGLAFRPDGREANLILHKCGEEAPILSVDEERIDVLAVQAPAFITSQHRMCDRCDSDDELAHGNVQEREVWALYARIACLVTIRVGLLEAVID